MSSRGFVTCKVCALKESAMTIRGQQIGRYTSIDDKKAIGAHYTPRKLADFVANQMINAWSKESSASPITILDPAAGDGELLLALGERLRSRYPDSPLRICGFESNETALIRAHSRLTEDFPDAEVCLSSENFLEYVAERVTSDRQISFFASNAAISYDLLIANPPYVRTQVMGSRMARFLAKQFGLNGRVDLYHAFMLAMARMAKPESLTGMIVSNRFMTTRSGANVRKTILENFDVISVWDFGDTKLFEAAVLPAVLIAYGKRGTSTNTAIPFTSIYETKLPSDCIAADPVDAASLRGVVETRDGRRFKVDQGRLATDGASQGVWRMANEVTETWLTTVAKHTWATFGDVGNIRVGVKTCADKVFIRSDWSEVPIAERPELLKPVTTHHVARRFKARSLKEPKFILYPHESQNGRQQPVNLSRYPRSAAYLEDHRESLEGRRYLSEASRHWFELWVPQNPALWKREKIVFRDIAKEPTFWIDLDGTVVNGDCYWMTTKSASESDILWLAVAVGNSSFIQKFYDYRFQNRLYAGRRRFMTQYVEQFPLPDPSKEVGRVIISKAQEAFAYAGTEEGSLLEDHLNVLVWEAFGLTAEEITG